MHHKARSYDVWFLRCKVQKAEVFCHFGSFLPSDPPNNQKNQNFEKTKNTSETLSFYTCAPQMMIIWCMIPEILSTIDRICCHFRLYFAFLPPNNPENQNFEKMKKKPWGDYHFKHEYHKWKSYDVQTEFFVVLGLLHAPALYKPRESKFWKNQKNTWKDNHFTQVYHI